MSDRFLYYKLLLRSHNLSEAEIEFRIEKVKLMLKTYFFKKGRNFILFWEEGNRIFYFIVSLLFTYNVPFFSLSIISKARLMRTSTLLAVRI